MEEAIAEIKEAVGYSQHVMDILKLGLSSVSLNRT
jgi:hypothetical protein